MRYKVIIKEMDENYIDYLKDSSSIPQEENQGKIIRVYGKGAEEENSNNNVTTLELDYDNPDNIKKIFRGYDINSKVKFRITIGGVLYNEGIGLDNYLYLKSRPDYTEMTWRYQDYYGSSTNSMGYSGYGYMYQKQQINVEEKEVYQSEIWILLGEEENHYVYKIYEINGIKIDSYCEGIDVKQGDRIFTLIMNQAEIFMPLNKTSIKRVSKGVN